MKLVKLISWIALNIAVIIALNTSWQGIPRLGFFFSPQHGYMQNAEPVRSTVHSTREESPFYQIDGEIEILSDERDVPHVFANSWENALFAQGYLHAKKRLFQMDMISRTGAGRLSEWLGKDFLDLDKYHRSVGIPIAAEDMEIHLLQDEQSKASILAYVAGVNFYIGNLKESQYPFEYKLLNTQPEIWNVYKTALIFKYISFCLSNNTHEAEYTRIKECLTEKEFETYYPIVHHFFEPIIREEEQPMDGLSPLPPMDAYQNYLVFSKDPKHPQKTETPTTQLPSYASLEKTEASNSWVVGGKKTITGYPILCNDIHQKLYIPSPWYEIQLCVKDQFVYGVSTPGLPFVLIGFNKDISWGITHTNQDAVDYYEIVWANPEKTRYLFDGKILPTEVRIEKYQLPSGELLYDTLRSTHIGTIINANKAQKKDLTIQWTGRIPSKEIRCFQKLNTAKTIEEVKEATDYLYSPCLTITFASRNDIGLLRAGAFPAKWYRQGDFFMPFLSAYIPSSLIPTTNNVLLNPQKNFVSCANQYLTDANYPYHIGSRFPAFRGMMINDRLRKTEKLGIADMMSIQKDNDNYLARMAIQNLLGAYIDKNKLEEYQKNYLAQLTQWDFKDDAKSVASVLFEMWWQYLSTIVWSKKIPNQTMYPQDITLLELLIDGYDIETFSTPTDTGNEKIYPIVQYSFVEFCKNINALEKENSHWWKDKKQTTLSHILRLKGFGETVHINGSLESINVSDPKNGASLRLIVSMSPEIEAYISYPGGQDGNPGSLHYNDATPAWEKETYNKLVIAKLQKDITAPISKVILSSIKKEQ